MRFLFLAVLLPALLAACSRQPAEAPAVPRADFRVIEHYEVGAGVYVRALAVDPASHALWVGTSLGAQRIDLDSFEAVGTYTRRNGLANEYVFTTLVDGRGDVWFGTNGGGLSRFGARAGDGDEWRTWFPMHGLADYWVYALAEGAPGTLWIGTWAGANRLDVASGRFETYHDELVNEWVYGIDIDARGRVWFGTEGGVSMFDGERWREWTHRDGLGAPNTAGLPPSVNTGLGTRSRHDLSVTVDGGPSYNPDYVFCIHVAADGAVWAGTWGGGASRFDGESWRNFTSADGLAGDVVFAVTEDAEGALWFGTDQGVSRWDGRTWQRFGVEDGIPGSAVYALAVTPEGEVWAGTRGGVARIGRADESLTD